MSANNKLQYKKQNERNYNTELITDLDGYDVSNLVFDEPSSSEIPGNPPVTIYRINVATKNPDGKEGNLVFAGGALKTYGIQEKHDQKSNELTGYSMSLMLFDDDGRSEQHVAIQNFIDRIVEKCKDFLLKSKKAIKRGDMERSDLKKISPIGFLKDKETSESLKDKPILSTGIMYTKPRQDKEGNLIEGKIKTIFYEDNEEDNSNPRELVALELLGKRGIVKPAIRIENIFIGPAIKVQVKIVETFIQTEERQPKQNRLLSKLIASVSGNMSGSRSTAIASPSAVDEFAEDPAPSSELKDSDNEDEDKPVVNIPVVSSRKTKGKK